MNAAIRDWIAHPDDTYYLLGTGAGPHPYPWLVRELQKVIGEETRAQILDKTGRLPDAMIACVGGGSNAIGFFYPFLNDAGVRLFGIEAVSYTHLDVYKRQAGGWPAVFLRPARLHAGGAGRLRPLAGAGGAFGAFRRRPGARAGAGGGQRAGQPDAAPQRPIGAGGAGADHPAGPARRRRCLLYTSRCV